MVAVAPTATKAMLPFVPSVNKGTDPVRTEVANVSFDISRKYPANFSLLVFIRSFSSFCATMACLVFLSAKIVIKLVAYKYY